jgi:hypothetical protein
VTTTGSGVVHNTPAGQGVVVVVGPHVLEIVVDVVVVVGMKLHVLVVPEMIDTVPA